jgi:hypothetical protein
MLNSPAALVLYGVHVLEADFNGVDTRRLRKVTTSRDNQGGRRPYWLLPWIAVRRMLLSFRGGFCCHLKEEEEEVSCIWRLGGIVLELRSWWKYRSVSINDEALPAERLSATSWCIPT